MIIKVYPGSLIACIGLDENGQIEVEDATTIRKLLALIKVPIMLRPLLLISVNGMNVDRNYVLKQWDEVSLMAFISGG